METQFQQALKVDFIYSLVISFSLQQNHIPIIRKLIVTNSSESDIQNINISLTFDPEFSAPVSSRISLLKSGEAFEIKSFDLKLSPKFLSELTERISGAIHLTIQSGDLVLFSNDYIIDVLAFDQWQGLSMLPEIVCSFITSNNPNISKIISRSSEILNKWTGNPSLDEYQSRNPDRVKKQMAAIFESIRELGIVYCPPPASFEESGQRIRMVDTLLNQKLGTCLDLSLVYSMCLEAIGINPIVVFIKGHAFAGAWIIDDTFPDSINDDYSLLSKRIADGINEILLVETTCMNSGNTNTFDDAVKAGNYHLAKTEDFILFVDVKRARFAGIRPLPQRIKTDSGWEFTADHQSVTFTNAPDEILSEKTILDKEKKEFSKQQLWERKLLDLSLRNNMLNTRITKSTIQLISVSLNILEDALAAGEEFQLLPKPSDWDNPLRRAGVYQALNQTDPIIDLVKNELSQKRLRTYLSETDLVNGLTNLYRSSRLSMEENGANTLYLSLGLLKWFETPVSEQPRFSPLLLIPVDIIRKSALKGFVIRSREEDTLMNITLLEMLRQDFKINITGLDPLPKDESGVDVKRIFNNIRQVIMEQDHWDIEEQAILGIFSFNKFIMWNDIHNNADKLAQNKIVSSLISGKAQWDVESNQFTPADLDVKYHPSEIILPISADSSQLEAICAAGQNKSFILHGPPGTGKSQTITNIIANALYNGKKVLFVAEKMAALEVVQRKLETIGIAPFCLELHSKKTKKSVLLEQLKRTTEIIRKISTEDFNSEAERIFQIRKELNLYVEALHKKYPFGFSLFEAFSGFASFQHFPIDIKLEKSAVASLTKEKVRIWTELAEELKAAAIMCGQLHNHPLREITILSYSTQIKAEGKNLIDKFLAALLEFKLKTNELTKIINPGFEIREKFQIEALNEICKLLESSSDIPSTFLRLKDLDKSLELIVSISQHGKNRNKFRETLLKTFGKDILNIDAEKIKSDWDKTENKWFIPRFFGQYGIMKNLKIHSLNGKLNKSLIKTSLDEIIEYRKEQGQIKIHSDFIAPILGLRWQSGDGDWMEIENVCQIVLKLNSLLLTFSINPIKSAELKESLASNLQEGHKAFLSAYISVLQNYQVSLKSVNEIQKILTGLLAIDFEHIDVLNEIYIENLLAHCNNWVSGIDLLRDWVGWNQTKNKAKKDGLDQLVMQIENGIIPNEDVVSYFIKNLYHNCADYIIEQDAQLSSFNGKLFEEKIRKFRQFNKNFEKLTKDELYAKLASKIPSFAQEAAQSSEIGILQRNVRNGGRGMSIRKLFDTIPTLITRICPCMLMSPISVAQYIDVNNFKFDLIIFDEASQMPTSEAVSAITRGNNLIVVGDPKQMPPTNFFSTNNIDEENIEKEDMESILDDSLALSLPSIHLLWHYRSKHESLITFSNSQFYENSLLTFPSPDDLITKVKFINVPGYYDRGKSRQNSFEAKAVIEEIIARLSDSELCKKSIGIVTFSSVQQILIEDLLNEAFKRRPDLEIKATESNEPIFIKNLENVQGDERDIILFSVGYGPDKEKKVNLNFGPLNREGGWRRLNVAVSRARYEMKVFSTLKAEQIDLTKTASRGVAGLKAFLEYAEKGKKSLLTTKANEIPHDLGLINSLAVKLKDEGFGVLTNIGNSGFKIDLGVINPKVPSEYLLGVLCDGPNYRDSKTAKDREIIQSEILSLLGWNTHKVWSCDWWDNQDKVIKEIIQATKNLKPQITQPEIIMATEKVAEISSQRTDIIVSNRIITPQSKYKLNYTVCCLPIQALPPQTDLLSFSRFKETVGNDILTILQKEAPISKELLCRRILTSWSVSRLGSRIDSYFNSLFKQLNLKFTEGGRLFYWNENQNPEFYFHYRISELESERRDASDISPEESSNAVHEILENMISLNEEDLIKETARLFGFNRIGGNVESSMVEGIKKAVNRGFAKAEDDRVFLVEK
jgi:hypothetical protein